MPHEARWEPRPPERERREKIGFGEWLALPPHPWPLSPLGRGEGNIAPFGGEGGPPDGGPGEGPLEDIRNSFTCSGDFQGSDKGKPKVLASIGKPDMIRGPGPSSMLWLSR
ncbi:MAG: hypothetical protein DMG05_29625 [Acidobacteria bacterium]|nr:MAG: hypothetical protein DMG05_29625 [Acidobacteriota bacterium]